MSRLSAFRFCGVGLRRQRRELDRPLLAAIGNLQELKLGQRPVKRLKLGSHLRADLLDELARVKRLRQRRVVLGPALLEILGKVLVGLRHRSAPSTQISLQRSWSRNASQVAIS